MPKSSAARNDYLKLYYNATPIANVADNAGSSPLTNLYFALHSADPGIGGDQTTSEVAYTSYARVAVARTSGGFTVTTNSVTNAATVSWPQCTGSSATATHFSVGHLSSGAGKVIGSNALGASLSISNLITPSIAAGSFTHTET